jgi:hypothetical protein
MISNLSEAEHVDGSLWSSTHFLRLPYSLNENTGLASLPLTREEMESFELGMAEIQNVEVNENWFELPEDSQERMERFFVDGLGFKLRRREE